MILIGKQMILVGEFLQLQPVPNMFDEGYYMFESPLFDFAICHRFALTKVMRQSEEDKQFLKVLSEIRMGQCGQETERYIYYLKRDAHFFPQNTRHLEAVYENETSKSMSWPGASVLQLKQGCKVMLVWHKSHTS